MGVHLDAAGGAFEALHLSAVMDGHLVASIKGQCITAGMCSISAAPPPCCSARWHRSRCVSWLTSRGPAERVARCHCSRLLHLAAHGACGPGRYMKVTSKQFIKSPSNLRSTRQGRVLPGSDLRGLPAGVWPCHSPREALEGGSCFCMLSLRDASAGATLHVLSRSGSKAWLAGSLEACL